VCVRARTMKNVFGSELFSYRSINACRGRYFSTDNIVAIIIALVFIIVRARFRGDRGRWLSYRRVGGFGRPFGRAVLLGNMSRKFDLITTKIT